MTDPAPQRHTRKEQQARTRTQLLQSAGRVFARHGLHQASVEQIVAEAGYTKGALYANFASKEDLFLALLEERFAERIAAVDAQLIDPGDPDDSHDHARADPADFVAQVQRDGEWERLFFEFAAHAGRDDAFRGALLTRWLALIARMASLIEQHGARTGVVAPGSPDRLALMMLTIANGVALQRAIDPGVADELLPDMLGLLTLGARAQAGPQQG